MSKAGIIEFYLWRYDFVFKIKTPDSDKTFTEFVTFKPADSFDENRQTIVKKLSNLVKTGTLPVTPEEFVILGREITNILSENYELLLQRMSTNMYEVNDENPRKKIYTYKYSENFKGILYETVIINGQSVFVGLNSDAKAKTVEEELKVVDEINEVYRIIKPMPVQSHACRPYSFKDEAELLHYLKKAHYETIDTLYIKSKNIVQRYVAQDPRIQRLVSIDIVWTYFQDRFPTVHYDNMVGDNTSGKTATGDTIEETAYRTVAMQDPSAANVTRAMGGNEPGQITIVLDEAEKINDYPEMLAALKAGYQRDKKIFKINTVVGYEQEFFYPFCYKFIISEKGLSDYKAKGVLDRTFSFNAKPGDPVDDIDIKEVIAYGENSDSITAGKEDEDLYLQERYDEIIDFRNTMMLYRILHFKDKIVNIDVGVKRRNKQLVKPTLQLFYGTEAQKEVEDTLEFFLELRKKRKENTLEAYLLPIVKEWFGPNPTKDTTVEKKNADIWAAAVKELTGEVYPDSKLAPKQVENSDFNTIIYKNTITNLLRDRFGAKPKKSGNIRSLVFNWETVSAIDDNYTGQIKIQCSKKVYRHRQEDKKWDGRDSRDSISEGQGGL